eukprot:gene19027-9586_t
MTTKAITQLRDTWRDDLLNNVMPFWLKNSLDKDAGGYFTCLDRDGTVLDTAKYHWLQGREVWTFSRLYNDLQANTTEGVTDEMREEWFAAAVLGAGFQSKALREDGQLFFSTTRVGAAVVVIVVPPADAGVHLNQNDDDDDGGVDNTDAGDGNADDVE